MKRLDEEIALSILFANTKRKKRNENLLTVAKACEYLVKLYGSRKAVAEKIGLSSEMIRQFLIVLKLPSEIQKLVSERKIDSIDTVKEISVVKEPSKQIAMAEKFIGSTTHDVRDIKRLIKDADVPVETAKKIVLDAKPKGLHIFIIDFDDDTYKEIMRQTKIMKIKPAELVRKIVADWLKERERGIKRGDL